jgi:hypothetical protein
MENIHDPAVGGKTPTSKPDLGDFCRDHCAPIELRILDMTDAVTICAAAMLNEPGAYRWVQMIGHLKKSIESEKRPVCIACDFVFWPKRFPAGFAIAMPVDNATAALISGICGPCMVRGIDFINTRALAHLRTIWPDLRIFDRANFVQGTGRA